MQVANYNGPLKFKFYFVNFHIALLNSICRIDLVPAPSQGFIGGPLKYKYSPHNESMFVVCLVSKVSGFMVDKTKSNV